MQSSRVNLVIFDLDGVLTETSKFHFESWKALAKKFDVDLDDKFEVHLKGVSRQASLERILKEYGLDSKFSEEEKKLLLVEKNRHYQQLISHMTKDDLFNGVIDCFTFLKSQGVRIALGSASKNAPRLLKTHEISDYFDYVVDPRGLKSKPSPDIFLDAMKHFNLNPSECIGVEDAYAGVSAINQAGMTSIGIGNKEELHHSDYCFSSIDSIPITFLKTLIKGDSS
ncbi:MAG: beta-phosphoglucomutase [Tenericutes bacterium]|nr:beta-phosphoglucomutase [Mycoplasmatota bacterium]